MAYSSTRNQEVEIVRVTIVVLFLSLVIVYAAYFQSLWTTEVVDTGIDTEVSLQSWDVALNSTTWVVWSTWTALSPTDLLNSWLNNQATISNWITGNIERPIPKNATLTALKDLWEWWSIIVNGSWDNIDDDPVIQDVNNLVDGNIKDIITANNKKMMILSWTEEFYWDIQALQVMWLTYQYILTDWEAYYAYLWTGDYDFASVARSLWGNVVEIVTEIDIVKNNLFGEKIAFVNIPGVTYTTIPVEQRQTVFMVIWWNNDRRLVQVDHASYHRLKPIIAQSFSSFYENN